MTAEEMGDSLARINAVLNALSFVFLSFGFVQIKKKRVDMHKKSMTAAVITSCLFLIGYLTRSALTGTHKFAGTGSLKIAYLLILFSHMILATVNAPLVVRTLYLAYKGRFEKHRRIARFTFPIWLYVSVTGVIVYLLLYHLVGFTS